MAPRSRMRAPASVASSLGFFRRFPLRVVQFGHAIGATGDEWVMWCPSEGLPHVLVGRESPPPDAGAHGVRP
jgi:hypothetical protein